MLRRVIHWFFGLCIFGGVLIILGALGASDLNEISGLEMFTRGVFGFLVIGFNFVGLKATGWKYVEE